MAGRRPMKTGYQVPTLMNRTMDLAKEVRKMAKDGRLPADFALELEVQYLTLWRKIDDQRKAYRKER